MERKSNEINVQMVELRREHFLLGLFSGSYNAAGARREATRLGIPATGYQYACLLAKGDGRSLTAVMIDPAGLVQEILGNYGRSFAIALPDKTILGLLAVPLTKTNFDELLRKAATTIQTRLNNAIESTVTVAIGEICHELFRLDQTYACAVQAMRLKEYLGGNRIYTVSQRSESFPCCPYDLPNNEKLAATIRKGSLIDTQQVIDEIIGHLKAKEESLRPLDCKFLFLDAALCLSGRPGNSSKITQRVLAADPLFFEAFNEIHDLSTLQQHLKAYAHRLFKIINDLRQSKKRLQIETAISYIQSHYAEHITLDILAEVCELSPSYFSKLFKSETGESFADYLTWLRVEKSIELLENPKMKIYEIAQEVGYSDVQYYNKVFRDITGVSPSFYRNHLLVVPKDKIS